MIFVGTHGSCVPYHIKPHALYLILPTMKHIISLTCLSLSIFNLLAIPLNSNKWNDGWLFSLSDSIQFSTPEYADTAWRTVSLPHDWSREGHASPYLASCTGYLPGGVGWYRKHFDYCHDTANPITKIYFEGIYNRSDIYLNGKHVGGRPNGYVSTEYDLSQWLVEGDNVIAVRVDHSRYADSRWYTGSGIYRDVWIYTKPSRHISTWGVAYKTRNTGTITQLDVNVTTSSCGNRGDFITLELFDMDHNKIMSKRIRACSDSISATFNIKKPHMWSLEDPYLYLLRTTLVNSDGTRDIEDTTVGLRETCFDPNKGFSLNGKRMKIKGVCLHHDGGVLGAAVPQAIVKQRLKKLKEIGVNAIRCSHNPQAPAFYNLCDSLGLMVMDEGSDEWEFPKRKWLQGWNVGKPGYDGTYDFFDEWIERDVTDMVLRDRTHPSVILWSVGNEVDYPNDPYSHPVLDSLKSLDGFTQKGFGGYNPEAPDACRIGLIAQRLAKCIRQADSSRPVTGALAGVVMSNHTIYPDVIDVVGYNYTEKLYEHDHAKYPDRIIYGSENRSDYDAWKAVRDKEYISGQFIWTGADYLGESGRWPSRGLGTGLLDFANNLKPRGYFRQSLWSDRPMAYLGTYRIGNFRRLRGNYLSIDAPSTWNYNEGDSIRVVCYTNQSLATLYLNDIKMGETKCKDDNSGIIYWDIKFRPGTIKVIAGNDDNQAVAKYSISTVLEPHSIRATMIDKDSDIVTLLVEVLDIKGNLCTIADNLIECFSTGGEILGMENGDNSDMSDYSINRRRVYNGSLKIYFKGNDDPDNESKIYLRCRSLNHTELIKI